MTCMKNPPSVDSVGKCSPYKIFERGISNADYFEYHLVIVIERFMDSLSLTGEVQSAVPGHQYNIREPGGEGVRQVSGWGRGDLKPFLLIVTWGNHCSVILYLHLFPPHVLVPWRCRILDKVVGGGGINTEPNLHIHKRKN